MSLDAKIYELSDRLRALEQAFEQEKAKLKQELKELLTKETAAETPQMAQGTVQYKYQIGRVYPSGKRDGKSAWIEVDGKHPGNFLLYMASGSGVITEAGYSRKVAEEELQKYIGTDQDFSTPVKEPDWIPKNFSGYPSKPPYKY